jgi:hypothetical protein
MLRKQIPASLFGLVLPISGLLLLPDNSAAQSYHFVSIDVPCGSCPGGITPRTALGGINAAGEIVGVYTDAVGVQHGFLLRRGEFITIDVPGSLAGAGGSLPTAARGISSSGDVVGSYTAPVSSAPEDSPDFCPAAGSPACIKGFLYSHGEFSTVLVPGHPGAIPQRITPNGDIYGCLHDFDLMGSMFGFARTSYGYISLAAGGGELADTSQSVPASMNNAATPNGHTIVGLWIDMMTGHNHGYVVEDGTFHSYDVPGSTFTWIWDMNWEREFVGTYKDASGKQHGFLQRLKECARFTGDDTDAAPGDERGAEACAPISVDYPDAAATIAMGINRSGAIVGQYTDTNGHTHGFLAEPEHRHDR